MKTIIFYFDPISPFAWLAFQRLPAVLMGDDTSPSFSYRVIYKPVLFAAVLKHHGQLGPAEIAPKRDWTYRHVLWLGHSLGVPTHMPAAHPFNPLPILRMALACATPEAPGQVNRYVAEQVLRHVWEGGQDAVAPARLAALGELLSSHMQRRGRTMADPASDAVKLQLRANTDEALAAGAFGVPTCVVDGKLFWGLDGLNLLQAYLASDAWFDSPAWSSVATVQVGASRAG